MSQTQLDETAVENFREYLRIPSVQPDVNYDECVAFLTRQAQSLDLPIKIYHIHPKKPIVILTWIGMQPTKPSILLNSHMDVDEWIYPPFSAHMDEEGNIYARGAQDMKCVGIQFLEAIRRLKLNRQRCQRTIHLSFVPDEEIGSVFGMKDFVHTADFKALNVGFALDEGFACPYESMYAFYTDKPSWHVEIKCAGNPGHGSFLPDNTAGEKLRIIIERFMDFRASEKAKMDSTKSWFSLGQVTTVNLTKIWGGLQTNIIPNELSAIFDIRPTSSVDHEELEATIKRWCEEAGPDVTYSFKQKNPKSKATKLDNSNPYWIAFKKTCDEIGVNLEIGVLPGSADSRFLREVDIPTLCFSPMYNTKIALHDHNEYLNKDIFLKGIEIYTKIIPSVANV
ncbi:PREDICTED: aminoacylase-1 [Wasmannia auropunctata]|uniref:aminoacylase-1 n=1 Tax=Wasmannia auropunctata TaxID=64793 RepID=UPI0005EE3048|nr:PREDICTED: aminoacylase-1 [Wasmannia auropunctata]